MRCFNRRSCTRPRTFDCKATEGCLRVRLRESRELDLALTSHNAARNSLLGLCNFSVSRNTWLRCCNLLLFFSSNLFYDAERMLVCWFFGLVHV